MGHSKKSIKKYNFVLNDLRSMLIGEGWTFINRTEYSKKHQITNSIMTALIRVGIIEKDIKRQSYYRWAGERPVTDKMVNEALDYRKAYPVKDRKTQYSVNIMSSELQKYSDNVIISELRNRGYTGDLFKKITL